MAVLMYYFTYVTNNPALMSYVGLIGILCSIVGSGFITPYLYALTKHKGKSTMYMWFVQAIGFIAMFFFDANGAAWWVLYTISQLAGAAWIGIQYGMVGDAVDYGEYKIGIRSDGFLASFCSFGMKFGGAVGPAVFLAVYASLGYVPNQAQSTTVLSAMNMSISLIPGILALALGIIYSFYKLSGEEHEKITAELERRREV